MLVVKCAVDVDSVVRDTITNGQSLLLNQGHIVESSMYSRGSAQQARI